VSKNIGEAPFVWNRPPRRPRDRQRQQARQDRAGGVHEDVDDRVVLALDDVAGRDPVEAPPGHPPEGPERDPDARHDEDDQDAVAAPLLGCPPEHEEGQPVRHRGDRAAVRDAVEPPELVAPVTERSGKTCAVVMRHAAQARPRQAVFHRARTAVQNDPRSRIRYEALRARGHTYGRALRGVADRLLGVACVLLRRRVLFDPDHGTSAAA
jgi:hypothetical protein